MKNNRIRLFATILTSLSVLTASARENVPGSGGNIHKYQSDNNVLASCNAATAQTELSVNNVRTTILSGGDMWWNLSSARYEIPKGSGAHSIFAGSLWIGGYDNGGQLKVAAMTYRQTGNDYWPGPLDTVSVSVDQTVCDQYDKHFRVKRAEVDGFYANCLSPQPGYIIPASILTWPGNGDPAKHQGHYLAPFYDANGDGFYNPYDCDFPDYDVQGNRGCTAKLYGDETLWWVFNDKGNIHTESGAAAIGIEIQAQAFGFNTNDEINNMTFYAYKVINRSHFQDTLCYFGQWVDSDLGLYSDDYVGCDVSRGLGYTYNGVASDGNGGPGTYGLNPPCLGVDFFQGPLADSADGVDNNRNCVTDEPNEQIIMSKFVYYNNDATSQGNPGGGQDIYNYLSGRWRDNTPITYGGSGHNTGAPCNFMFPDLSDQTYGWGLGGNCTSPISSAVWSEPSVPNVPADRRFLQTAGPFTLKAGAVNNVKVGVVWARASSGNNLTSIGLVKLADDKAQKLFENCFQVLNGPDAPDITIQELDKQLVVYLTNKTTSNNYLENYTEYDPLIIDTVTPNRFDTTFNFEGYQVYQIKNNQVGEGDLHDIDKARLVFQCDVKNGVAQIINFNFDQTLNANVPEDEVDGADKGVTHSFVLTDDKFASGDVNLVNHKTYYYMSVAYGYNNYVTYAPDISPSQSNVFAPSYNGQKKPYKVGRKNVKVYTGIPHIPSPEANGTAQASDYGVGPKITRVEGRGNGGQVLDLTQSSINYILANNFMKNPTYENSHGPINVKVIDPLNVPDATFTFVMSGIVSGSGWTLTNNNSNVTKTSEKTLGTETANEQIIPEWGLSVAVTQVYDPGSALDVTKGYLTSSMTFSDVTKQWLTGVQDADGYSYQNWIRSGTQSTTSTLPFLTSFNDYAGIDDNGVYENVVGGIWAPYRLCAYSDPYPWTTQYSPGYLGGPGWSRTYMANAQLKNAASVDVFITADKSKWTRCCVLEEGDDASLNQPDGGFIVRKMDLRSGASVDKNGVANYPSPDNSDFATGMGWFPGYAINVETGERLNMAFGENSWLANEKGRDMIWNPTSNELTNQGGLLFGGQHYIYVFGHNNDDPAHQARYDAGFLMRTKLTKTSSITPTDPDKRDIFQDAMWASIPLLKAGHSLLESEVHVRLRVKRAYAKNYSTNNAPDSASSSSTPVQLNHNRPMYTFNTTDLKVTLADHETAKNALDLINIVPNPYYAFSEYEKNQLFTTVKITNLPEVATVKIYTLNGTLIRTFKKDDPKTSLDWDLKNTKGIPIASGMYIIYVNVPDVGEKILKWFGVLRPIDLDQF